MPIIDFRYRPSTRESIDSVMTNPVYSEYVKLTDFPKRPVKSLDACIEELKELGIVKAVVAGRDCESSYDTPNTNTSVLECIEKAPDLFIGFYGFDPGKGMPGLRAFRTAVERDGACAARPLIHAWLIAASPTPGITRSMPPAAITKSPSSSLPACRRTCPE